MNDGSFHVLSFFIEGFLSGGIATSVAALAVAAVGFHMMSGRVSMRNALRVVVGCFILFGAPLIVGDLMEYVRGNEVAPMYPLVIEATPPPPLPQAPARPRSNPFDPNAR